VTVGISKTLYPVVAQLTDVESRRRALSDVLAVGTFLVWPLLGLLAGSASIAVRLLFGPGWEPAAALIAPLCLFAAANLSYTILASATESIGWLKVGWAIQGAWAVALGISTIVAWQLDADPRAYLYGYAGVQIVAHCIQAVVLARRGLVALDRIVKDSLAGGLMALAAFVASLLVTEYVDGQLLILRLAAALGVTLGAVAVVALVLPRSGAGRALASRGLLPEKLRWTRIPS
jgi:O-antigen/teichoic acid export membrane protein